MYYQDFVKWSAGYMRNLKLDIDGVGTTDEENAEWNGAADALVAYGNHAWGIDPRIVGRDIQRAYDELGEGADR